MRKTGLTVVGSLLVVAGLVMLVAPGPGVLVIAIGLAVLASAGVVWAARLLVRTRERLPDPPDSAPDEDPGMVGAAMGRLDDAMDDLEAVQQVEQEDEAARERQHHEDLVTTDEAVQEGTVASSEMQARVVRDAGGDPPPTR